MFNQKIPQPAFLKKRKQHKLEIKKIEHALFELKYCRRVKEDELDAEQLTQLKDWQKEIKELIKDRKHAEALALSLEAEKVAKKLNPAPGKRFHLRENVEVFVVVMAVAMGIRTYFLQPYQIPTGSMQPTLYGITSQSDYEPDDMDRPPMKALKFFLTGSRYREIRAQGSGIMPAGFTPSDTFRYYVIGGQRHKIHKDLELLIPPGRAVQKGDLIAKGLIKQGDFIVVDRFTFNFRPPRRGEITVFSTRGLPMVRPNSAYIKRTVGLPGETIHIQYNELVADGEIIREPEHFVRQQEGEGYRGYSNRMPGQNGFLVPTPLFPNAETGLTLGEDEYLMFGDNTYHSLDSRYFGGVPGQNILGKGIFVPWPFFNRGTYNGKAGPVK